MEFNQGILNKIEEGMSFARSVVIFLLGFGMIVFDAYAQSEYGAKYFNIGWYEGFFRVCGIVLLFVAITSWVSAVIQVALFGKTFFSMSTEIKQSKHDIESLIFFRLKGATGKTPPDHVVEVLRSKPHLIPLVEEFLSINFPDSGCMQDINNSDKPPQNSAAK